MKTNNQKGFIIPLLIGIIALLIIGGGIYIYSNKKTVNNSLLVINSNLPATTTTQTSTTTRSCVPEGEEYGANNENLKCCKGLVFQPITYSGTIGKCVKQSASTIDATKDWKIYTNTQYSFSFKYPQVLNSLGTVFNPNYLPSAIVGQSGSTSINSNGCYISPLFNFVHESKVTINNMPFCLSTAGDPGAGQLENYSYYTTLKNGNYITLTYEVHTSNGCGALIGEPNYNSCMNFFNNYDSFVTKPIQDSVATLKFTN